MRQLVLYTLTSLDGEVDHPGQYFLGSEPGAPPAFDQAMDANEARVIGSQDAVLLGRGMYDEWSHYWPRSTVQPFAGFINGVKYVVTSSPLTHPWTNAEAVSGPIEQLVSDLKSRPGGDIGVHGSITLAQSLLAADLVDRLELVVGPVAGVSGRRLFETVVGARRLELLRAESTPTGSLLLSYRVAAAASA